MRRESLQHVCIAGKKSFVGIFTRQQVHQQFVGGADLVDPQDAVVVDQQVGYQDALALVADAGVALEKKESFVHTRTKKRFNEMTPQQKMDVIRENPLYGRVICRCETVTEGEIVDALHRPIPPRTIDGVKRRCTAGMGRCQGGFCGPRVLELISRELGIDPLDILQDKNGSNVLLSETKVGGKNNG